MTKADLESIASSIVTVIKQALDARVGPVESRLAALEARSPSVEYAGVFDEQKTYAAGQLVTRRGGLWLTLRETNQPPGADPHNWRLVVKEGRAQ